MKKYRILSVHNYYQISGGEDTVVANEKKMMESCGHTVISYVRRNEEIRSSGILRRVWLGMNSFFSLKTYLEVKDIIKKEEIDIVHVHNTVPLISPSVFYAALWSHVPVVQTIHNFRPLCPNGILYRDGAVCEECLDKGLLCAVRHRCYRGSVLQTALLAGNIWFYRKIGLYKKINLIALTEFNKEKLLSINKKRTYIDPDRVFVKPNFTADGGPIVPFPDRKKQMVYAGRLEEAKGVKLLFKTWRKFEKLEKGWELIVCGTGSLQEWCLDYIEKKNIRTIRMLGSVEHGRLMDIIGCSRALLMPTCWYEGFGLVVAESFSRGTPVIGSSFGNVGDMIKDGINGWGFKKDSEQDFLDKLCRAEARELTETAYNDYKEKYSVQINYDILMDIYGSITRKLRYGER